MKIIAEIPESKERQETEVASLEDRDLKRLQTFHYPQNRNPEQTVRMYIESQDISADEKARYWEKLKVLAQAVLQVGKNVLFVGRKILDFVVYLVKRYPNLAIGLALGAVFGSLIAAIPFFGFFLGGLAKVFLPLIGGFMGFKGDLANQGFNRRVFEAINDEAVENTVEQEINIYKPLNKRVQSTATDEESQFKSGLDRGMTHGAAAMKTMLVAQAEQKFGKETADDLKNLLSSVDNLSCLTGVGCLLLKCTSSNEFLKKASESLN